MVQHIESLSSKRDQNFIRSIPAQLAATFGPLSIIPLALYVTNRGNVAAGELFGPLMAAATMVTAPLVLGFLLAQRRFVQGITSGGLKG